MVCLNFALSLHKPRVPQHCSIIPITLLTHRLHFFCCLSQMHGLVNRSANALEINTSLYLSKTQNIIFNQIKHYFLNLFL